MRKLLVFAIVVSCCLSLEAKEPVRTSRRELKSLRSTPVTNKASATYGADRIGIGFNSQISNLNLNSLSARYWMSNGIGIQGLLGFNFGNRENVFDLGAKIMTKVKEEENIYLYAGGLLGLEYDKPEGRSSDTNWSLGGFGGYEFFFKELPNLGFSVEIGLRYKTVGDNSSFGTTADLFNVVGIHYYF